MNEAEVKAVAKKLGEQLLGGEVIELIGDVGSGKTTFTKGLAAGLGVRGDVQSPSFTISRVYEGQRDIRLAHYDFYRLPEAGIMASDLAEAVADPRTVVVVEWGGAIDAVLPNDRLTVSLQAISETRRHVRITAGSKKSQQFLEALQ